MTNDRPGTEADARRLHSTTTDVSFERLNAYIESLRPKKAEARGAVRSFRILKWDNKGDLVLALLRHLRELRPAMFRERLEGTTFDATLWNHRFANKRKPLQAAFTLEEARSILAVIYGTPGREDAVRVAAPDELPPKWQEIVVGWRPPFIDCREFPSGSAAWGEIEIRKRAPDGNLVAERHSPVDQYVAVFVDEVEFRQKNKLDPTRPPTIQKGKYVRIEVPNDPPGAVVLPVDQENERVLLVRQYRHPQRQWLIEAPRGFGIAGIDRDAAETGRRELEEETGAELRRTIETQEGDLVPLRRLYTDTGKLLDRVHYFLAFVKSDLRREQLLRIQPTMEDPVWVKLPRFYEAVFSTRPVPLEVDVDFEYLLDVENRRRLFAETDVDRDRLHLQDAFTVTAALLAMPELARRLAGRTQKRAGLFDLTRYRAFP
jgi:8-oxo-dGTP pyrophosphatase MutT (NUDIX family)